MLTSSGMSFSKRSIGSLKDNSANRTHSSVTTWKECRTFQESQTLKPSSHHLCHSMGLVWPTSTTMIQTGNPKARSNSPPTINNTTKTKQLRVNTSSMTTTESRIRRMIRPITSLLVKEVIMLNMHKNKRKVKMKDRTSSLKMTKTHMSHERIN